MKKILGIIIALTLIFSGISGVQTVFSAGNDQPDDVFYDDFSGDTLDSSKWLVAEKMWGGFNGGVVPENVSVSGGTLRLEGHGNLYTGDIEGENKQLPGGIRTGAAIATREYYGSGSYEVVAKVAPEFGACSAIWTFQYEEHYEGDPVYEASGATGKYMTVNHEIDIELPTANDTHPEPSFECARFNTYTAENRVNSNFHDLPYSVDDGQFHTYRFDWHTGDEGIEPRVDFYVDDIYICTSTEHIPTNKSRLWIGIWFPSSIDSDGDGYGDTGWTGTADFDTTVFEIDSVTITPFNEAGDTIGNETYPKDGWAPDSFPEDIAAENYDHILNGDFSQGSENWELFGDAKIQNGKAVLSSGAVTDTIVQRVKVLPKMTYNITADIETDGTEIKIGTRKPNGTMDTFETITKSGKKSFSFVTDAGADEIEVYAEVLRYQEDNEVTVDNITLYSGKTAVDEPEDPEPETTQETTENVTEATEPATEPETTDTEPTEEPEEDPVYVENLLVNGSFDEGEKGWILSGGTVIEGGRAMLASGSDTDTISQIVSVKKGGTYTLSADIISSGAEISVGVRDYQGRYTELEKTVDESGTVNLIFTVADYIDQVEIFAQVLRYQNNTDCVDIDNICLLEGDKPEIGEGEDGEEEIVPPQEDQDPGVQEENLLQNGDFSHGDEGWQLIGSAEISNGKALLASGLDTDIAEQRVSLESNKTYKLTCDIETVGCEIELAVSGYDGKYSEISTTYNISSKGELIFTTGENVADAKVVLRVLRYQPAWDTVEVTNVMLAETE